VKITKPDSPAFGREIVFLDTPGHEAFTRMRARGAKITDIVVVVVAADDGVMPQTLEAIDHAKAANVPIIVAVNKIDKPEANPDRVKQQLADRGLQPEAWGGTTVFVDVSAKKRTNLDLLEEMICLVADLANLKATPDRPAVGTVIEAKLDRGRGAVASRAGAERNAATGDSYIVGNTFGKIRAMFNDRGQPIRGWAFDAGGDSWPGRDAGRGRHVPGDGGPRQGQGHCAVPQDEGARGATGEELAGIAGRAGGADQARGHEGPEPDCEGRRAGIGGGYRRRPAADVDREGAGAGAALGRGRDYGVGRAAGVGVERGHHRVQRAAGPQVAEVAERENVEIRLHSIIYELRTRYEKAMYGLLEPVFKENYAGKAEVINVFKITKVGQIAGCRVTDGIITRTAQVRVMREGVEVWRGKIGSLKRFKDDVSEVRQGVECGIDLAGSRTSGWATLSSRSRPRSWRMSWA
jgi:translation initiation factor IF-2